MSAANQEEQKVSVYKGPNKLGSKKDFPVYCAYPDKVVQKIARTWAENYFTATTKDLQIHK
jgi:hypothetical protein